MSPIIWNLVFDGLLELFDTGPVKIVGFADDAALLITGADPNILADILTDKLKDAKEWATSKGLKFAPAKCQAMHFHRLNNQKTPKAINMDGDIIDYVSNTRYLGVIIDNRLNWTEHIIHLVAKAKRKLLRLRACIGALRGPLPMLTRWLWTGIIQPILNYGAVVWYRAALGKVNSNRLDRLSSVAMRLMGNFRKSTPTSALQVALGIIPPDLSIQRAAVQTLRRLELGNHIKENWSGLGHGNWVGHIKSLRILREQWDLPNPSLEDTMPIRDNKCKITFNFDSLLQGNDISGPGWRIYTDGSKLSDTQVGSGFVVLNEITQPFPSNIPERICGGRIRLGDEATVFQAEIDAISYALEQMLNKGRGYCPDSIAIDTPEDIQILTDSQATFKALANPKSKSKMVNDCKVLLNSLQQVSNVTLHWIKAHVGHYGNEEADEMAKAGAELLSPPGETLASPAVYKRRTKLRIEAIWNERWNELTDARQAHIFYQDVNMKRAQEIYKLNRHEISLIIRFTTGHNFLRYQRKVINPTLDGTCRLCEMGDIEDAAHVIIECPRVAERRYEIFGHHTLDVNPVWNTIEMLKMISHPPVKALEKDPDEYNPPT